MQWVFLAETMLNVVTRGKSRHGMTCTQAGDLHAVLHQLDILRAPSHTVQNTYQTKCDVAGECTTNYNIQHNQESLLE